MGIPTDLGSIVLAIGGLGTAAFALVDVTKIGRHGGLSDVGFDCISSLVHALLGADPQYRQTHTVKTYSVLDQLHANWINGVDLVEQRRSAKAALKLELNKDTAASFAHVTGVDPALLATVIGKLDGQTQMDPAETAAYGRFDFVLGTMIDAAYRRADQKYRNKAKFAAGAIAVVLSVLGGWALSPLSLGDYLKLSHDLGLAFLGGVMAVPLAPVAHDLANALAAGKNLAQALRGK